MVQLKFAERRRKNSQKEQAELDFIPQVCIYKKKKKMYISIYRMVKEYTSFAVAQWKDDYKVVFLLFDLIWFFFFPKYSN